ncbi:MAG: class I SAM-dependent methyltransferase [Nitrospiraceae bacterium]|nr:class I SAM-dependent methyltransferase [Nitrospiraceae bacterium]
MSGEKKVSLKVRHFWEGRASEQEAASGAVTHKDIWQRWLEIEMICRYLDKKARVLDIGCGNGHSTRIFARKCREIVGMDYSDAMIERARKESGNTERRGRRLEFCQGDVLDLGPERFGLFDIAISERCLINLADFVHQKKAIRNIASILKPGGRFVFIEGSAEGRQALNAFRRTVGLAAMPKVWYNVDFREKETVGYLRRFFVVEERQHFGIYDFLSRVVHPLISSPEEPRYDAKINEVAARLALVREAFPDMSRVLFLVLKRK